MTTGSPDRTYTAHRRVGLGDADRSHELRLDAVARYLQDVAADDVRDAGLEGLAAWVVRRTELRMVRRPRYGEPVEVVTWCSGTGPVWAERCTSITGPGGARVDATSLWVSLDPVTMRPVTHDDAFFAVYGEAARVRVPARLRIKADPPAGAGRRRWPLRQADFDILDHVNNAVAWAAVEEAVPGRIDRAVLEYRSPVESDAALDVVTAPTGSSTSVWLLAGDQVAVAAEVSVGPGS